MAQLSNCTDASFAFKFADWVNYMDFTLDVRHTRYDMPWLFPPKREKANAMTAAESTGSAR
jgi:hypothetical protein